MEPLKNSVRFPPDVDEVDEDLRLERLWIMKSIGSAGL